METSVYSTHERAKRSHRPSLQSHSLRLCGVLVCALAVAACSGGKNNRGGPRYNDAGQRVNDAGWPIDDAGLVIVTDAGTVVEEDGGFTFECHVIQCGNHVTACGDCVDNDGDGLTDWRDPECLGPCDNYEGEELLSGVGGETGNQCHADCYFDFGNGSGGGDCQWHRSCDPLEPMGNTCPYDEGFLGSGWCPDEQPANCESKCRPLTPNGCDCFGCCTFPELAGMGPGGGPGYVFIGSENGCTFDTVTDPAHCAACTPVADCNNTCERCEVCIGKPTVPADCNPGGMPDGGVPDGGTPPGDAGIPSCPDGLDWCDANNPCPSYHYCVTGCCIAQLE